MAFQILDGAYERHQPLQQPEGKRYIMRVNGQKRRINKYFIR